MYRLLFILYVLLISFIFTGCEVLINPSAEINVLQNDTDILSGDKYDFGQILVGESSQTITFTIESLGNIELILKGDPNLISVSGDTTDFVIDQSNVSTPLKPGDSSEFTITFVPTSEGAKSVTISIANNDLDENPFTIVINGEGTVPEMNVKQGSTNIISGSGVYDFGEIKVGETSPEITFTIENTGTGRLELINTNDLISVIDVDASMFTVNQTSTNSTLLPGETTDFTVIFLPSSIWDKTATISIENTDFDENPYTFEVKGKGITAPEINIKQGLTDISSGSGEYDFGEFLLNDSSLNIEFTIENLGTIDLELNTSPELVNITGSDSTMFSVNDSITVTPVVYGTKSYFTISFQPTATGTKTAKIEIYSNDYDENPYTFTIKGKCVAPEINVKQGTTDIPSGTGSYDFGYTDVNVPIEKTFTIQNLGDGNLILNGNPLIEISGVGASGFSVTAQPSTPIISSTSTTFKITFTPPIADKYAATVSIANNDQDEDPYTFSIFGNGSMYVWTKQFGGSYSDNARCVTTDSSGNIYVAGEFAGAVNFGADFGVNDNKTANGRDVFITKINANGTYGWTKVFGGQKNVLVGAITTDTSGNIYFTGCFNSLTNFAANFGATDNKTPIEDYDLYITKINANGTYGWTKHIGAHKDIRGFSVITDKQQNIFISGYFEDTTNFGKDFGVSDVKVCHTIHSEIFVTKINANGTYGWSKTLGTQNVEHRNSIALDSSGNIYIVGTYYGNTNFGLDFGVNDYRASTNSGGDITITKINANGTYGWTKCMGGTSNDVGLSITIDTYNNIYCTGYFVGTVDFGSDFNKTDIKTSYGKKDLFVTKIDSNATYYWTKQFGGTNDDSVFSIITDSSNNIYLTGNFSETVNFGKDFGVTDEKTAVGSNDAFLTKINSNGTYRWTRTIGGFGPETGYSLAIDSSDNIFILGIFYIEVNFAKDFGGTDIKTSYGSQDVFITKLRS